MDTKNAGFSTKLIHAGEPRPLKDRAITLPIFQSSTFEFGGEGDYNDIRYSRLNNTPNHIALGEKLAALEGGEAGLVAASGMAAITTALLAVVPHGKTLLVQDDLYGGTHHFLVEDFPAFGRKVAFFPVEDTANLDKYMTPDTVAIYVEAVSNPLLKIPDLDAVAKFAKKRGILSLIDNTFPSPHNFNPISLGFDVVLHSATKYLNGHTDIIAGAVIGNAVVVRKITVLLNHMGGTLDPHACFLLHRGMKTLGVRMKAQNESGLLLARALEKHEKISKVIYPGLESHPHHARAKEYLRGFGGMVTFEYKGDAAQTDAFLKRLQLPFSAPSLGGVESLVTRPATTSHSGVSKKERDRLGVTDSLVRVSVGLEDPDDLISDFRQAL